MNFVFFESNLVPPVASCKEYRYPRLGKSSLNDRIINQSSKFVAKAHGLSYKLLGIITYDIWNHAFNNA